MHAQSLALRPVYSLFFLFAELGEKILILHLLKHIINFIYVLNNVGYFDMSAFHIGFYKYHLS